MDSKKSSMIKTKYYGTDDPDYFGSRSLDESQGITYLLYFKECITAKIGRASCRERV